MKKMVHYKKRVPVTHKQILETRNKNNVFWQPREFALHSLNGNDLFYCSVYPFFQSSFIFFRKYSDYKMLRHIHCVNSNWKTNAITNENFFSKHYFCQTIIRNTKITTLFWTLKYNWRTKIVHRQLKRKLMLFAENRGYCPHFMGRTLCTYPIYYLSFSETIVNGNMVFVSIWIHTIIMTQPSSLYLCLLTYYVHAQTMVFVMMSDGLMVSLCKGTVFVSMSGCVNYAIFCNLTRILFYPTIS